MHPTGKETMTQHLLELLVQELRSRGFSPEGWSPNGTMILNDDYLASLNITNLLDIMVTRREKIFRSVEAVGRESASNGYDDAVLAIEATKATIDKLLT